MEGIVDNPQGIEKPICKSVDIYLKVNGPAPYTHMDGKHPVVSEILRKQNSPYTLQEMANNMGESIVKQKERFCEFEQGPESSENVLHIIDLAYVPSPEKEIIKEYCLKGAGSSKEYLKYWYDNRVSKSCWSKVDAINKSWKSLIRSPFSSASDLRELF